MEEIKLCDYGCGEIAKHQFKNGKWCCNEYLSKCLAMKEKNKSNLGKIFTEDHKRKIGDKNKGKIISKEARIKMSKSRKGKSPWNKGIKENKKRTDEYRNKMSIACQGKIVTKETKIRMSLHQKGEKAFWFGKKKTETSKIKCRITMLNKFKDVEFLKKIAKANNIKPNNPESLLIDLFKFLNLNYNYTGNRSFWVDGRNPDFVNYEKNKIIEFFGEWWHGVNHRSKFYLDFDSNIEHEQKRIKHFIKNGYKCLIIWENELKDIEILKDKILNFESGE